MRAYRISIAFAAALLAASVCSMRAQTPVTIQPSQVAAIINGTTTRNTVTLTSTNVGADAQFLLNITNGGAVTGTLQVFLEDSLDGGTTWNDLGAFAQFTFGGAAATQTLSLFGRTDGPGLIRSIAGTTPAAGAEITETVPTGARWELLSFSTPLTTSATAANRVPALIIDDGANVLYAGQMQGNETASLSWTNYWYPGAPNLFIGGSLLAFFPIPAMRLGAGSRIKTVTAGIQAGDQYAAPKYAVREWRDLPTKAVSLESFPAGQVRSGPWGDRIRVREVITNIAGSPTGPTYTISAVYR